MAYAGMFTYALFGTSRQLAVTPASSSAAMLAALAAPIAAGDSSRYVVLASGAAIAAGIIFVVGGLLRLGAVSEFISKPVLKGFVFGLALTIMVKQAHKLTGISAGQGNFFQLVWHVIPSLKELSPWTCAVGAIAIAVMFLLGAVVPRVPSALVVPCARRSFCLLVRTETASRGSRRYDSSWNALPEPAPDRGRPAGGCLCGCHRNRARAHCRISRRRSNVCGKA